MKNIIILFLIFCVRNTLNSKETILTTKSKSDISKYIEAKSLINKGKFKKSKNLLEELIKGNSTFIEARILLATLNQKQGKLLNVKKILKETTKIIPKEKEYINILYEIAYLYYRSGMYKNSQKILRKLKISSKDENLKKITRLKRSIIFALNSIKKKKNINLKKLEKPLNTFAAQYFPVLTIDKKTLIFTGRKDHTLSAEESLYISYFKKGIWTQPKILSNRINTKNNEGACTISSDGNILIFSAYKRKENIGSCDLYICYKKKKKWSFPKNLGPNINTKEWQSQPSLSPDGKTLYFSSKRKGNIGKKDIWKSEFINGKWQKAINLGKAINTVGNEISPFIHPNNKILYFASDRSPSLGGLDIYYSEFKDNKWAKPKNLGYPINNYKDQVSIFITADGKKGYFAQGNQKGIYYNGILYEFNVPQQVKPKEVCVVVQGRTEPKEIDDSLLTKLFVFDIIKSKIIYNMDIHESGIYSLPLIKDNFYDLIISKKNHEIKIARIDLKNYKKNIYEVQDIKLKKIKTGDTLIFKNILFDFDKYEIKKEFEGILKGIIIFLKENINIKLCIQGFTDYRGSQKYNKKLSIYRARAIYEYLVKKGIHKTRLTYQGLGQIENKSKNNSDEQMRSRKVCFKVL